MLRSVDIPDNLKSELSSSIIRGWKLVVAEKNLSDRREELHIMIRGLKEVRNAADSTKKDPTPMNEHMLHTAILCALPLMRSDLTSEDMLNVRDLLSQSMDDLAFSKLGGMIFSKNRRGNDLLSC